MNIVIVEGHTGEREELEALVTRLGHVVHATASGKEALHEIAKRRPDVVLLDLSPPGIDGLEVVRRIRRLRGYQPLAFIVLSRWERIDARVECKLAGIRYHLLKPVMAPVLKATLQQIASHQQRG